MLSLALAKLSPAMKALLALKLALILLLGPTLSSGYATTRSDFANPRSGTGLTPKRVETAPGGAATNQQRVKHAMDKLPVSFVANRGQADGKVKFLSRGNGYSVFLTSNEAVLSLCRSAKAMNERKSLTGGELVDRHGAWQKADITMKLSGANSNPHVEGLDELPGKANYFKGKDPTKWRTGVANYSRVRFQQVYPGIDLIYKGAGQQLEYDFVVAPGGDPNKIRMEFTGATKLEINAQGDLILHTVAGDVHHRKPFIYQEVNGERRDVIGRFVQHGRQVGFEVGSYDRAKPLVIDPVIAWSTLLGGGAGPGLASWANGIATYTALDGNVYVYVVGITTQTDFPVRSAFQPAFAGMGPAPWAGDVFVTKFNMGVSGDPSLIWSTYLGGSGNDYGASIAIDAAGNAHVTGDTGSTDFPILKATQSSFGGGLFINTEFGQHGYVTGDAFVTALNSDGASLIYSTYLGGSSEDKASAIAVDAAGNAYVTGKTSSRDFPVVNAYQPTLNGSSAAFVAKVVAPVSSSSASLVYSTYLGGSSALISGVGDNGEGGTGIAVDSGGNAYVTGNTGAFNFPILNGFQTEMNCGKGNVFVAKLNPSASGSASLLYSTYLGGSCGRNAEGDTAFGIALDSSGNAYVTGQTISNDFPTTLGAFMRNRRTSDTAFVAKIDPSQNGAASLIYSTLLGGFGWEEGRSIALDPQSNAYVAGLTFSFDFPVVNAAQSFSSGGVFQSIDNGSSWAKLNKGLVVRSVSALAVDTSTTPRTLYAGSPSSARQDLGVTATGGVFKSNDGGTTWNAVNNALTNKDVKSLLISPSNPSTIYAGTAAGVFVSTDGAGSWSPLNAGLSTGAFTTINTLITDTKVVNGTNIITLYLGTDAGLYKMVEGGSGWTATAYNNPVACIIIDPQTSPHTIYVTKIDVGAYLSTDGGSSWNRLDYPGSEPFMMAIDTATTPSTLYAIDLYVGRLVKKRLPQNLTWEEIDTQGIVGGDPSAFVIDERTTPSTLYISDLSGGIAMTTDGGSTWTNILRTGTSAFVTDKSSPTIPAPLYASSSERYGSDAFIAKLNSTGSALLFSTCLGDYGSDEGNGIALDPSGNIYVAGKTQDGPFPAVNAYQAVSRGGFGNVNAFVTKLGSALLPSSSTDSVTTQMAVQTGTLELSFPNITGSTSGTAPTATVNALDSATTANLTLSNNLGAYEIKTTATYNTSGYATDPTRGIKIAFSVPTVNDLTVFNNLVISHGEDANGDNVIQPSEMIPYNGTVDANKVTNHDFATRTVWVYVPSLSPFVIVKGAVDQFSDLVRLIKSFNLKAGIENSLDAKLQNALQAYQATLAKDRSTACNKMGAFVSEVQAQTSKALTQAQANQLMTAASQIKVVLGCR